MDANVPPIADERAGLLGFLAQQRRVLKAAAHGLNQEQLRAVPTASTLSIGALLKHTAITERGWLATMAGTPPAISPEDYGTDFRLTDEDTSASRSTARRLTNCSPRSKAGRRRRG